MITVQYNLKHSGSLISEEFATREEAQQYISDFIWWMDVATLKVFNDVGTFLFMAVGVPS